MTDAATQTERFLEALNDQTFFKDEQTAGSIRWYIDYYKRRAPGRRIAFRASGFLILFLGISLPMITGLTPEAHQASVASILAWLIAVVAAANSFFNWQQGWQGYTQTQLSLQFALAEWDMAVAEARSAASDEEGLAIAKESLKKLVKSVTDAIAMETAQFFEGVKFPESGTTAAH